MWLTVVRLRSKIFVLLLACRNYSYIFQLALALEWRTTVSKKCYHLFSWFKQANSCLLTHPTSADKHLYEAMFLANIYPSFCSVFGLYRLLLEISGSLAARCSTVFTCQSLTLPVCCLVFSSGFSRLVVLEIIHWARVKQTVKLWAGKPKQWAERHSQAKTWEALQSPVKINVPL